MVSRMVNPPRRDVFSIRLGNFRRLKVGRRMFDGSRDFYTVALLAMPVLAVVVAA
jgi:hypothetical protein